MEEIAVYDDLLVRFGNASEAALREAVARGLSQGLRLGALGRSEEIAIYDDLLARSALARWRRSREGLSTRASGSARSAAARNRLLPTKRFSLSSGFADE